MEHSGDLREEAMIWRILEKTDGKIIMHKSADQKFEWRKGHEGKYMFVDNSDVVKVIGGYDIIDTTEMNRWYGAISCLMHSNVLISSLEDSPLMMTGDRYQDPYRQTKFYDVIKSQARHFLARTRAIRICMVQLGINFEDVSLIPLDLDLERFKPRPKPINLFPEAENNKVVLYVGRLEWNKGVIQLVDQFAKVASKMPNVVLLIIGEPVQSADIIAYLNDRIKFHRLENKVKLLGYVNGDISQYYNLGDVFVSLQFRQYGWTFFEALASGLPIISNDIGVSGDYVVEGQNGFLAKRFNSVSDYMLEILQDDSKIKGMGKVSREIAEREHNPDEIFKEFMGLYDWMINTPRHPLPRNLDFGLISEQNIREWVRRYYLPMNSKPS